MGTIFLLTLNMLVQHAVAIPVILPNILVIPSSDLKGTIHCPKFGRECYECIGNLEVAITLSFVVLFKENFPVHLER